MRVENWCGYDIRFVEVNSEWYAILKDICDALGLRTNDVANRLDPSMLERVLVEVSDTGSNGVRSRRNNKRARIERSDHPSRDLRSRGDNKTRWMLAINEIGIYEALFASRRLEARKFRMWAATVLQKLRMRVGLEGYEVMKMTDPEIQDDIDHILDNLFYDEETGMLMESVTVQGGGVEQIPFEP